MGGRNWTRARNRDLSIRARREDYDRDAYLRELSALPEGLPSYERRTKHGPVTLRCSCGHKGTVDTRKGAKFRCSKCNKLWIMPL